MMIKGLKVVLVVLEGAMCMITGLVVAQAVMWLFFESTTMQAVKDSPFFFGMCLARLNQHQ